MAMKVGFAFVRREASKAESDPAVGPRIHLFLDPSERHMSVRSRNWHQNF